MYYHFREYISIVWWVQCDVRFVFLHSCDEKGKLESLLTLLHNERPMKRFNGQNKDRCEWSGEYRALRRAWRTWEEPSIWIFHGWRNKPNEIGFCLTRANYREVMNRSWLVEISIKYISFSMHLWQYVRCHRPMQFSSKTFMFFISANEQLIIITHLELN